MGGAGRTQQHATGWSVPEPVPEPKHGMRWLDDKRIANFSDTEPTEYICAKQTENVTEQARLTVLQLFKNNTMNRRFYGHWPERHLVINV
jgi:hypothetical protein